MYRFVFYVLGVILSVFGLSCIVIYLNLLSLGYSLNDYLKVVFSRGECLCFFVGYVILLIIILVKKEKKI